MNHHTGAFVIFLQPLEKMPSLIFLCIVIYCPAASSRRPRLDHTVPSNGDAGTSTEVGFSQTSGIWLTMGGVCCPAVNVSSLAPTEKVAIDHSTCISSDGGYFVNISNSYFIFQLPVFVMLDI